eukprot:TRINITY_DN26326_c0_g1_i7.p1 TRINITY_DN26326_c0_g1~~TRINITY_DN26326_c0_g1_i7.p1  ORF type:complete len:115 (+),score=20.60 TRINITY_DN26326_c0_g1_i7:134-478(+)
MFSDPEREARRQAIRMRCSKIARVDTNRVNALGSQGVDVEDGDEESEESDQVEIIEIAFDEAPEQHEKQKTVRLTADDPAAGTGVELQTSPGRAFFRGLPEFSDAARSEPDVRW